MESRPPGSYDQKNQTVGHQVNAARDVNIRYHGQVLVREGRSPTDAIENEFGQRLSELEGCYVQPSQRGKRRPQRHPAQPTNIHRFP